MICRCAPLRFGGIFDFDGKCRRISELKTELQDPNIWATPDRARDLNQELSRLERIVQGLRNLGAGLEDIRDMLTLAIEEQDIQMLTDLQGELDTQADTLNTLEHQRMFCLEEDPNNAFVDIQSGSGGTEAQDWADMLMRMYMKWGDAHGMRVDVMELSPGDVAGIKSVTLKLSGDLAYGWLRTETGVHRLVRKSPFDSGSRRHTSFASVFVTPEIDDNIDIKIDPSDLRVDTYRSQGAGGQHVNTTDSAVRITHVPTGIVVQCQSDRSQHKNKAGAMKQLRAKLYQREIEARFAEQQSKEANKQDISWGSQIRSYVLDDSRIKDLRTGVETGNTQAVLDGRLDDFLIAALKSQVGDRRDG